MAAITTAQAGDWHATATWTGGVVPGYPDTVILNHAVTITANAEVGNGAVETAIGFEDPSLASLHVGQSGSLTLDGVDVTLSIDGDVYGDANVTMQAGTHIVFPHATGTARWEQARGTSGDSLLTVNGTEANPCSITCSGGGRWRWFIFSADGYFSGCGRIVATWCTFSHYGDPTTPVGILVNMAGFDAAKPCSFTDCVFDQGFQVGYPSLDDTYTTTTGTIQFTRCHFKNRVVDVGLGDYTQLVAWMRPGMTHDIVDCRFEERHVITHPAGMAITGNVFENGIWWTTVPADDYTAGSHAVFEDNYIVMHADNDVCMNIRHGDTITRCIYASHDPAIASPVFCTQQGDQGVTAIDESIAWSNYSGAGPAGGVFLAVNLAAGGTTASNVTTADRCLMLPNENGLGAVQSMSAAIFQLGVAASLTSVAATRCTAVVSDRAAIRVGEGEATPADSIAEVHSCLFVGDSGATGHKLEDFSPGAATDAVINTDMHHNGGYQLAQGAAQAAVPASGKGYSVFPETAVTVAGLSDVDDQDPNFTDPRTPLDYDVSVGGPGTLPSLFDQIGPFGDYSVAELHAYLMAGYAPQNAAFDGAGYLGVDIGAVDVVVVPSGSVPGNNGVMLI